MKHITVPCLLLLALGISPVQGQLIHERSARWGGSGSDQVTATALAPDGSMLLSGTFNGTIDLDPGPGQVNVTATPAGTVNCFAVKLGPDGSYAWGFALAKPGIPAGVAFATAGDALVAWSFNGAADIDPGPGQQLTPNQGNHTAVQRLDAASGALISHLVITSPVGQFFSSAHSTLGLEAAPDGGFAIHGSFGDNLDLDPGTGTAVVNSNGGADAFIARYAADMSFAWGLGLGGIGNFTDQTSDIRFDADGALYAGGFFNSGTDFDPGAGQAVIPPASSGRDACVAKYGADGSYLWHARMLSPGSSDGVFGLEVADGQVLLMGAYETSVDADPGPDTQTLNPISNQAGTYFVKLSASSGELASAAQFDQLIQPAGGAAANTNRRSMALTGDGHFVIAVELAFGVLDMQIGPGVTNLQPNSGVFDIGLARYAWDDLTLTGAVRVGGTNGSDNCRSITANESGHFLIGGEYRSTTFNVNPSSSAVNLSNAGSSDGFVARFSWSDINTAVTIRTGTSMSAYPNPFMDRITFTGTGVGHGRILDASGRLVAERQGSLPMAIDLGELRPGAYIAHMEDERGARRLSLVKH